MEKLVLKTLENCEKVKCGVTNPWVFTCLGFLFVINGGFGPFLYLEVFIFILGAILLALTVWWASYKCKSCGGYYYSYWRRSPPILAGCRICGK
jgi:hypothetical protein